MGMSPCTSKCAGARTYFCYTACYGIKSCPFKGSNHVFDDPAIHPVIAHPACRVHHVRRTHHVQQFGLLRTTWHDACPCGGGLRPQAPTTTCRHASIAWLSCHVNHCVPLNPYLHTHTFWDLRLHQGNHAMNHADVLQGTRSAASGSAAAGRPA